MTPEDAVRESERAVWKQYGLTVQERFVTAGGRRVRVLECGDPTGAPIVFVQGGLGEGMGWMSLLAKLGSYRCITLDRPGGGLSDGVDFTHIDVQKLAVEVLTAVLDAAGVEQATFVANSMGGWWSFQLAQQRPERVTRLVLLGCPALLLDSAAPLPMRLMSIPVINRALVQLMVPSSPDKARGVAGILGHPKSVGAGWSPAEAEAMYCLGQLPNLRTSWRTLIGRYLRLTGTNPALQITAEQLRKVPQPTLFLWGAQDPFGSPDVGRAAAKIMPDARLEVVGIGHLPWWDDRDACAQRIRAFVPERGATKPDTRDAGTPPISS